MKHNKKNSFILWAGILDLFFLFFYFQNSWSGFVGTVLFVIFILITGLFWSRSLKKAFGFGKLKIEYYIIGYIASYLSLSFVLSVFTVFYRTGGFVLWLTYVISAFCCFIFYRWIAGKKIKHSKTNNIFVEKIKPFKWHWVFSVITFGFIILGFYFLKIHTGTEILNSPWQVIGQYYLPTMFIVFVLLGVMVFSNYKPQRILFFLILGSILVHSYLAMSHEMPWGGDAWRLIGVEQKLADGGFHPPVLLGPEAKWREFMGADVPEVFLIPQKYTYAHFWSTNVLFAKTFGLNLVDVHKWVIPILWSICAILFLFIIGKQMFGSNRSGHVIAWISLLPFTLQAVGAISLPVSLGFIPFLFLFAMMQRYSSQPDPVKKKIILIFLGLMIFGYTLHFLLALLLTITYFSYCHVNKTKKANHKYYSVSILVLTALLVPLVEIISKISRFPAKLNIIENIKQAIGIFSGWFFASQMRTHDILPGNIFFNHAPDYAFVLNIFTAWRWYAIPISMIIWIGAVLSFLKMFNNKKNNSWILIILLSILVIPSYLVGWFVLEGDRLFTRRLDHMIATILIILICPLIFQFVSKLQNRFGPMKARISILIMIAVIGWFGSMSYASGPDMRVVSVQEVEVARYVKDNIGIDEQENCVLADTWILLALEGETGGKVVGGGFPMDYQFGQMDRVRIFNEFIEKPEVKLLDEAILLTGADKCTIILKKSEKNTLDSAGHIDGIIGNEYRQIREFFVWTY